MDQNSEHQRAGQIVVAEVEVKETELCFVTAVNKSTRTFFAQFCKFTNQELVDHNITINQYCNRVVGERSQGHVGAKLLAKRFHKGDIICARYANDGFWYRAKVLKQDKDRQVVSVIFLDYGNLETVTFQDTVCAPNEDLPLITRAPFGVTCSPRGIDLLNQKESDHLLESLTHTYAMINVLSRLTSLQWLVEIPMHAYNRAFWDVYKPGAFEERLKQSGREKIRSASGDGV